MREVVVEVAVKDVASGGGTHARKAERQDPHCIANRKKCRQATRGGALTPYDCRGRCLGLFIDHAMLVLRSLETEQPEIAEAKAAGGQIALARTSATMAEAVDLPLPTIPEMVINIAWASRGGGGCRARRDVILVRHSCVILS